MSKKFNIPLNKTKERVDVHFDIDGFFFDLKPEYKGILSNADFSGLSERILAEKKQVQDLSLVKIENRGEEFSKPVIILNCKGNGLLDPLWSFPGEAKCSKRDHSKLNKPYPLNLSNWINRSDVTEEMQQFFALNSSFSDLDTYGHRHSREISDDAIERNYLWLKKLAKNNTLFPRIYLEKGLIHNGRLKDKRPVNLSEMFFYPVLEIRNKNEVVRCHVSWKIDGVVHSASDGNVELLNAFVLLKEDTLYFIREFSEAIHNTFI